VPCGMRAIRSPVGNQVFHRLQIFAELGDALVPCVVARRGFRSQASSRRGNFFSWYSWFAAENPEYPPGQSACVPAAATRYMRAPPAIFLPRSFGGNPSTVAIEIGNARPSIRSRSSKMFFEAGLTVPWPPVCYDQTAWIVGSNTFSTRATARSSTCDRRAARSPGRSADHAGDAAPAAFQVTFSAGRRTPAWAGIRPLLGGKEFLILSTHGGIRAADGTPVCARLPHRPLGRVALLMDAAAKELKSRGAIPVSPPIARTPATAAHRATTGMFDSLPYRNDAASIFRRLIRSLPTRSGGARRRHPATRGCRR